MYFSLELLFSSVGDVQYSECIFKINVASLSIFKANMGKLIELFRIKWCFFSAYIFVYVTVNAVSSFVSWVSLSHQAPDVQM